ncbi:hypothetical protein Syun_027653 [Stephania yunnanensis]|uniref:Glutaredoxin domain-containing protein n=1 Tax=Stephania yunnanensis TaxID=152371 RepID=A0AAP0HQ52_9MAGN
MQEALPYRSWPVTTPIGRSSLLSKLVRSNGGGVKEIVGENAVLVIGRKGCCMSHVMKRLLLGLGVNPTVCEVEEEEEEAVVEELTVVGDGGRPQFPVVYIGGRLFGGLDRLMGAHITGELIPLLKQAGGLWL